MNSVLLTGLVAVSIIGAVFTILVVVGIGCMCMKLQEDVRHIDRALSDVNAELSKINQFNGAVTDCISNIGQALDVINERTNWLDGLNEQVSSIFSKNKNGMES